MVGIDLCGYGHRSYGISEQQRTSVLENFPWLCTVITGLNREISYFRREHQELFLCQHKESVLFKEY